MSPRRVGGCAKTSSRSKPRPQLLLLTIIAVAACATARPEGTGTMGEVVQLLAEIESDRAAFAPTTDETEPELWPVSDDRGTRLLTALGRTGQEWWCGGQHHLAAAEATNGFSRLLADQLRGAEALGSTSVGAGVRFIDVSRDRVAIASWLKSECALGSCSVCVARYLQVDQRGAEQGRFHSVGRISEGEVEADRSR